MLSGSSEMGLGLPDTILLCVERKQDMIHCSEQILRLAFCGSSLV